MSSIAVVSLVTRNYLHYARALAISVKESAPDVPVLMCVADDPGKDFRPPPEWDVYVQAKDLGIPQWRRFAFQYTPFELACALKPYVVEYALNRGHSRVAYLDGDMQVYSDMFELRQWLNQDSIVLTPHAHWSKMTPGDIYEQLFLVAGAYNAGFFALRDSEVSRRFLAWWKARVAKHSIHDLPGGYFVDQKWLDLVPGMFPEVRVCRHLGYNVGHWMLSYEPAVRQEQGRVTIDGDPLSIFHFSGFRSQFPELISHHAGCTVATFPALAPLCDAYAKRLKSCGQHQYEQLGCEFDKLSDGTPIVPVWREIIRQDLPELAAVQDPFDVSANPGLVERLTLLGPKVKHARTVWRLKGTAVPTKPISKLKAFGKKLEKVLKFGRDCGRAVHARLRLAQAPRQDSNTQTEPRKRAA
jgi:hypothetical protein